MNATTQIATTILAPFMALSGLMASSTPNSQTPVVQDDSACVTINHNLSLGARDQSVVALQDFLSSKGYFTLSSSGYFGDATKSAVMAFQKDAHIAPTGFVGAKTRAAIQTLCTADSLVSDTATTTLVRIRTLTPATSTIGGLVAVTGSGFTNDNTVHFGNVTIAHVPITSAIAISCTNDPSCVAGIRQTLIFNVPVSDDSASSCVAADCKSGKQSIAPGVYDVVIENDNGTSNALSFTVTSS